MKYLLAYFVVGAITAIEITAKWQHDCPRERLRTGSAFLVAAMWPIALMKSAGNDAPPCGGGWRT